MVSETVQVLRTLTRPLRRQFWWPKRPAPGAFDEPGVVVLSFPSINEAQQRRLGKILPHCRAHKLADDELPADHTFEHDESERLRHFLYRVFLFVKLTLVAAPLLLRGKLSWSRHLCQTDDLARLYIGLSQGRSYLHLGTLQTRVKKTVTQIKSFISGLERKRYEIWVIARGQKLAFLPSSLQLPEEPLMVKEVVEMAHRHPCFFARTQNYHKLPKPAGCIRVMTYNLHSCIGLDGRNSVQRIAEILHRYDPDFVALQELDAGCSRSGGVNQLEELRRMWPSEGEFFPLVDMKGGSYGIGYLTRLPVVGRTKTVLPGAQQMVRQEPRGLIQVKVRLSDQETVVEISNTHLGLTRKERTAQIEGITEETAQCEGSMPQILLGDFNCSPQSPEYGFLTSRWKCTQPVPEKTWFGTFPVRHLDYCFMRGDLEVVQTEVPRDSVTRLASDHLPIITDLRPLETPDRSS